MTYAWKKSDIGNHNVDVLPAPSVYRGRHKALLVEQAIRDSGLQLMRRVDIAKACNTKLDASLHGTIGYLKSIDVLKRYAFGVYYLNPEA